MQVQPNAPLTAENTPVLVTTLLWGGVKTTAFSFATQIRHVNQGSQPGDQALCDGTERSLNARTLPLKGAMQGPHQCCAWKCSACQHAASTTCLCIPCRHYRPITPHSGPGRAHAVVEATDRIRGMTAQHTGGSIRKIGPCKQQK